MLMYSPLIVGFISVSSVIICFIGKRIDLIIPIILLSYPLLYTLGHEVAFHDNYHKVGLSVYESALPKKEQDSIRKQRFMEYIEHDEQAMKKFRESLVSTPLFFIKYYSYFLFFALLYGFGEQRFYLAIILLILAGIVFIFCPNNHPEYDS